MVELKRRRLHRQFRRDVDVAARCKLRLALSQGMEVGSCSRPAWGKYMQFGQMADLCVCGLEGVGVRSVERHFASELAKSNRGALLELAKLAVLETVGRFAKLTLSASLMPVEARLRQLKGCCSGWIGTAVELS
jgi:hypothetical protein